MENKGKVKNVLVFGLEQFQEDLIWELINNNISYVKIDNEFHFLDKIYRFFEFSSVKDFSIFHDIVFSDSVLLNPTEENFVCSREDANLDCDIKRVSYTKRKIKEDNRRINARLNARVNTKANNFRR